MKTRPPSADRAVSAILIYSVTIMFGFVLSGLIFPGSALVPNLSDDPTAGTDTAQHIVGQRYFIADAWRWPLLNTPLLAGPVGTNIAMTDSIPLMALAAKALRNFLPRGFHTIYLWLAISYTLQPAAAAFALRSAGERRLLPCLAAAGIAASMPAWFARAGHSALSGHFLILLALGLSFQISAGQRGRVFVLATLLLVASLLIHPYLMVMVAAMLGAAPVSLLLRGDRAGWTAALGVVIGLAMTALVGTVLGYVGFDSPGGFGIYSMNLLSPIYPAESALFPNVPKLPDPTGGEFEGYNYLGCGALVLAGVAVSSLFRLDQRRALAHHGGLDIACLALTGLALSNHVYLGDRQILDLGPVPDTMQQFRASGRFFWPVAYVIVIAGVAAVSRLGLSLVTGGLLVAATILQIADAGSVRSGVYRVMHEPEEWRIDVDQLRPLLASHRSLIILPVYGCGPDYNDRLLLLLLLASEYLIPVNTMYVARFAAPPDCSDAMARSKLQDGELRLFYPPSAALIVPDAARLCGASGDFGVCSLQAAAIQRLPKIRFPILAANTTSSMQVQSDMLASGWSTPGSDGTWTDGDDATIAVTLNRALGNPLRLTVWGVAIAPKADSEQTIAVSVNGKSVATWQMPDMTDMEMHADIPPDIVHDRTIVIRFGIAHPVRPIDRAMNDDTRRLGLQLSAFRIEDSP